MVESVKNSLESKIELFPSEKTTDKITYKPPQGSKMEEIHEKYVTELFSIYSKRQD